MNLPSSPDFQEEVDSHFPLPITGPADARPLSSQESTAEIPATLIYYEALAYFANMDRHARTLILPSLAKSGGEGKVDRT